MSDSDGYIEMGYSKVTVERLIASGVWWNDVLNFGERSVRSCRDAVTFRDRLGSGEHGGVPLWVELKSQIGIVRDESGRAIAYFAAHTRANRRFLESAIIECLSITERISIDYMIRDEDEDEDDVGTLKSQSESECFGLVNPFNIDCVLADFGVNVRTEDVFQLFDNSLMCFGGHPNTIMTNIGVRTRSFEIGSKDMIDSVTMLFPRTIMAPISSIDPIWLGLEGRHQKDEWKRFPPPSGPKIGILTGNSPESGLTLWNDFLNAYRKVYKNLADVLMPEVVVHSFPEMGLSMELVLRKEEVWRPLKAAVLELLRSGCKVITLACNTTIYFEPRINELCRPYGAIFVSIAEACLPAIISALEKTNTKEKGIGLVGIGPVIDVNGEYSGYKRHLQEKNISVTPCQGEQLAYVMKNIGVNAGEITSATAKFRNLVSRTLPDVTVVVLSLTEVSLVYRKHVETKKKDHRESKVFIDPLFELARYLVHIYLLEGFRSSEVSEIPDNFDLEKKLMSLVYA